METSMIEKHNTFKRTSTLAIRPFTDDMKANMGLERVGMVVHEGIVHEEPMVCLEYNGIKRYLNGLNEFAPELRDLPEDDREAKIKEIRRIVSQLEKDLASNVVNVDDKDFWNKVTLLKPDNFEFWEKIIIRCGNEPVFIDPVKDPYDLIKLKAIEAGGFSMVAKSLQDARTSNKDYKWYLDKYEDTAAVRTEVKKLRNKALAELEKLFNNNTNKLLYVCKIIDINSTQYKKSTPNDILYDNMDKYINGESVDKDKKKTAQKFLDTAQLSMEDLITKSIVKDSTFYKLISVKSDGFIYHLKTNSMLGKNPSDVFEYLKNPLNEQILTDLTHEIEKYWI